MFIADDWSAGLSDGLLGLAVGGALVAAGLVIYWAALVPLSYGYNTWKEYILKGRTSEMTWPQRVCGFLFAVSMIVLVVFPVPYFAAETLLSIGDAHSVWLNLQPLLVFVAIGLVWIVILEVVSRWKWQPRDS